MIDFYFLSLYGLLNYCLFAVISLALILIFQKKIPELFSIFFLISNLVVYSLFFSISTKYSAGVELYPMVLPGVCYILSFELKKPKWLCPSFALLSGSICLYEKVYFGKKTYEELPFPPNFYYGHEIFTTIVVIIAISILCLTYERVLLKKLRIERKQREELLHIANHDPLTGLINRRRLWEHLYSFEIEKVEKDIDFVISIFDIDYFKRVNDTYGHDCGDFVLVEVSKLIKENLLKNVKIGRWGGEEFLLLYRGYSNEEVIEDLERLRALVDNRIFDYLGTKIHITITLGVSSSTYCDSAEHVIADADKQLMKGKIQGKNRVVARNIQKGLSENDAIFDSFIDSSHKD